MTLSRARLVCKEVPISTDVVSLSIVRLLLGRGLKGEGLANICQWTLNVKLRSSREMGKCIQF